MSPKSRPLVSDPTAGACREAGTGPRLGGRGDKKGVQGQGKTAAASVPINDRWYYAYFANNNLQYVGRCKDSIGKRINQGYGRIHPKNYYRDGQQTNCRLNWLITNAGPDIGLWLHIMDNGDEIEDVERRLIDRRDPPWNIQKAITPVQRPQRRWNGLPPRRNRKKGRRLHHPRPWAQTSDRPPGTPQAFDLVECLKKVLENACMLGKRYYIGDQRSGPGRPGRYVMRPVWTGFD